MLFRTRFIELHWATHHLKNINPFASIRFSNISTKTMHRHAKSTAYLHQNQPFHSYHIRIGFIRILYKIHIFCIDLIGTCAFEVLSFPLFSEALMHVSALCGRQFICSILFHKFFSFHKFSSFFFLQSLIFLHFT